MATESNPAPPPLSSALPPPRMSVGAAGWIRANLFSTWLSGLLTVTSGAVLVLALWYGLDWVLLDAEWTVVTTLGGQFIIGSYNSEQACPGQNCFWRPQAALLLVTLLLGMGWGVAAGGLAKRIALIATIAIALLAFLPYSLDKMGLDVRLLLIANLPALLAGWALARYTALGTARWIVILSVAVFLITLVLLRGFPGLQPILFQNLGGLTLNLILVVVAILLSLPTGFVLVMRRLSGTTEWALARYTAPGTLHWITLSSVAVFLIMLVLLRGIPGLQPVLVQNWGGLTLNLVLAVAGIVLSLPIGIALALGRRSNLPVVKSLCVTFIEVFRGVPLITLLFMSQHLLPLAFPQNFPVNPLFRAAVVITLFSAAYMAENIRGGLQALHPGQAEAARALGLPGWQTTLLISLPQAIRNVIPAIVGQFIGLFKDTSLVYIIGMVDIVRVGYRFVSGNTQYLDNAPEVFIFISLVFWVFTYGMSYVSRHIERQLGVGER